MPMFLQYTSEDVVTRFGLGIMVCCGGLDGADALGVCI